MLNSIPPQIEHKKYCYCLRINLNLFKSKKEEIIPNEKQKKVIETFLS